MPRPTEITPAFLDEAFRLYVSPHVASLYDVAQRLHINEDRLRKAMRASDPDRFDAIKALNRARMGEKLSAQVQARRGPHPRPQGQGQVFVFASDAHEALPPRWPVRGMEAFRQEELDALHAKLLDWKATGAGLETPFAHLTTWPA